MLPSIGDRLTAHFRQLGHKVFNEGAVEPSVLAPTPIPISLSVPIDSAPLSPAHSEGKRMMRLFFDCPLCVEDGW